MASFLPLEIIKKKRNGKELTEQEIKFIITSYTSGETPDYQMSAFLMATFFKGMSEAETLFITKAMLQSGSIVEHKTKLKKSDKHSTGGVGDKTSLILGPIVAACGIAVPMISGRGLGHTGGTLDKLESIPGFNTQISLDRFISMVDEQGISFIGQTPEICPADKKVYALRDVTGTIESLPLICASIMSKKLAEGIDSLVLDVKHGSGAFMKDLSEARKLALALKKIGEGYGKKVTALLTNMNQPLGFTAGNALEVQECVDILQGKKHLGPCGHDLYEDTKELSLQLSAYMILASGGAENIGHAYELADQAIDSGKAYSIFERMIQTQGGDLTKLPTAEHQIEIKSPASGFVESIDTEKIGMIGIKIKMGRSKITDLIEPTAGFKFHYKIGDKISKNDVLVTLLGAEKQILSNVADELLNCYKFSATPVPKLNLIQEIII